MPSKAKLNHCKYSPKKLNKCSLSFIRLSRTTHIRSFKVHKSNCSNDDNNNYYYYFDCLYLMSTKWEVKSIYMCGFNGSKTSIFTINYESIFSNQKSINC